MLGPVLYTIHELWGNGSFSTVGDFFFFKCRLFSVSVSPGSKSGTAEKIPHSLLSQMPI